MVSLLQNWTTLLVLFAALEECIKSIAKIMLRDFEPKRQKTPSITTFSAGVVECLFNCTNKKVVLQLALTQA